MSKRVNLELSFSDGTKQIAGPLKIVGKGKPGTPSPYIKSVEVEDWYVFADTSWSDISRLISEKQHTKFFHTGDKKTFVSGNKTYTAQIVKFTSFELESHSWYSGIYIDVVECIPAFSMSVIDTTQSTYTYKNTTMNASVNMFYSQIEDSLKPYIKKVYQTVTNTTNTMRSTVLDYVHPYDSTSIWDGLNYRRKLIDSSDYTEYWLAGTKERDYYPVMDKYGSTTSKLGTNVYGTAVRFVI